MRSSDNSDPIDVTWAPVATPEDIAALRRLRELPSCTTEEYFGMLAQLPQPSIESLRSRRGPRGPEPFRL